MTKQELISWIRRKLGEPMVRVELHDSQIEDCLFNAREEYIKWGSGSAVEEVFFTIALSAGVSEYELPSGVTEIVKIREFGTSTSGINTLFTTENYMYNHGMLSFLDNMGSYSFIDYFLALQFLDLLEKFTTTYYSNYYNWRYNRMNNKLKLKSAPSYDLDEEQVGYLLVHSWMLAGTDENTFTDLDDSLYNVMWDETWVRRYALACAKETLGLVRRKFASFSSIGNEGISLDGDALISEANEEKQTLEERLRNDEESSSGWPIYMF